MHQITPDLIIRKNKITILLQLGEVWTEVISELDHESVRPITPDREALEIISRTVHDRAEHVQEVQKELLAAQHQQDFIDEQEYYAEVGGSAVYLAKTLLVQHAE